MACSFGEDVRQRPRHALLKDEYLLPVKGTSQVSTLHPHPYHLLSLVMSDPITATIQVAQLGISAVRAGAAIANAWSNRSQRKAAESSTEAAAGGNPYQGASIEEILLVLATLGQRLLLLDVVDFDVLPQASEAVRSAMRAVDSKCDDVGEDFDDLEPILQHLVACAYVFCAACHPMPIWYVQSKPH